MKTKLIRLHAQLCRELNIPRAKLLFCKRSSTGRGNIATYRIQAKTIVLYMEDIAAGDHCARQTLAHETRHHYQMCKGWFGVKGERWKRDSAALYEGLAYHDYPWEKDAVRYERKIAKREGWVE